MRLAISAIVIASLALPATIIVSPVEQKHWPIVTAECSGANRQSRECVDWLDWFYAKSVKGYATTYDAFYAGDVQSWYSLSKSGKAGRNGYLIESKKACAKNPQWKCRAVNMGGWIQYRRTWKPTTENLYAALGPYLRSIIASQMPKYHTIPSHKLRITSLETRIKVVVWIADYCKCNGYVVSDGKKIHPLVDLSPEAWAEMGREEYYINGKRYYRNAFTGEQWGSNWITVEYLP